jgi:hypothetical protein
MDAIRWPSVLPMAILGWFVCLTILGVWLVEEWFGRPERLIPPDRRRVRSRPAGKDDPRRL